VLSPSLEKVFLTIQIAKVLVTASTRELKTINLCDDEGATE
jgi:hypothetical protein